MLKSSSCIIYGLKRIKGSSLSQYTYTLSKLSRFNWKKRPHAINKHRLCVMIRDLLRGESMKPLRRRKSTVLKLHAETVCAREEK